MNFNKYNGNTEQETYLMKKAIKGGGPGPGPTPSGSKMYLHTIHINVNWHDPMEGREMGELGFITQLTLSKANAFTSWYELYVELIDNGHSLIGSGSYMGLDSGQADGLAVRLIGSDQTMEISGLFDGSYTALEKAIDDDTTIQVFDYVMEA